MRVDIVTQPTSINATFTMNREDAPQPSVITVSTFIAADGLWTEPRSFTYDVEVLTATDLSGFTLLVKAANEAARQMRAVRAMRNVKTEDRSLDSEMRQIIGAALHRLGR